MKTQKQIEWAFLNIRDTLRQHGIKEFIIAVDFNDQIEGHADQEGLVIGVNMPISKLQKINKSIHDAVEKSELSPNVHFFNKN